MAKMRRFDNGGGVGLDFGPSPSYQTPADHFTNLPSGSPQQFNAMRSAIGLSPMEDSNDNDANIQKAKAMMGSIVGLTPNDNNYSLQDAISQLRGQYSAPAQPIVQAPPPPIASSPEPDFMAGFSPSMRARFAANQARSKPEGPDQERALMARFEANQARANAKRDLGMKSGGGVKAKGSKVKKFAEGGEIDNDFGAMNEGPAGDDSYTPAPKAEPKTRGEAFRAARAAGDKTFEFEGKKYTTELAKPKSAAKEEAPKFASAKSPGIMQRMRDADAAMVKSAQAKTRQGNADLGSANAGPSGTGGRLTGDRMSPAYGQGRVNPDTLLPMKKGGSVKKFASGGSVSSRADGCAQRGKTRGTMR